MMNDTELTAALSGLLLEKGLSRDAADRCTGQFSRFWAGLSAREKKQRLQRFGGIDGIADSIIRSETVASISHDASGPMGASVSLDPVAEEEASRMAYGDTDSDFEGAPMFDSVDLEPSEPVRIFQGKEGSRPAQSESSGHKDEDKPTAVFSRVRPDEEIADGNTRRFSTTGNGGSAGNGGLTETSEQAASPEREAVEEMSGASENAPTRDPSSGEEAQFDFGDLSEQNGGDTVVRNGIPVGRNIIAEAAAAAEAEDAKRVHYTTDFDRLEKGFGGKGKIPRAPLTPLFVVLSIVTLPVTLPIAVTVAALFIASVVFLGVFTLALFILLAAAVVAGSALCLIGIFYGVTQCVSGGAALPAGIYEIGLGVAIGGATMLIGILLYNLAVRVMPLVLRGIVKLFGAFSGLLETLVLIVRKECYDAQSKNGAASQNGTVGKQNEKENGSRKETKKK